MPAVSSPARAAPQMQTATNIVISEFRTRGSGGATDEFIEIFNSTGGEISISNWVVKRSSGCGSTIAVVATIPSGISLLPGEHYLIGGSSYNDAIAPDLPNQTLNIADNGGIAIFQSDGVTLIDKVGLCAMTSFVDGNALLQLTTNVDRGYERKLGGNSGSCEDINDNLADFSLVNPSAPQSSSSTVTYCVGVQTFTPTNTVDAANATGTASALTSTAAAVNLTATASAANLTNTAAAANTPTNTGTATSTSPASTTGIVISEFRTRGPGGASDEFIELYNPTSTAVDISGWKINASNNAGSADTRATIPASTLLRSGQYYLVANNGYTGSVIANLKYGTAITNDGGIALLTSNNTIVDEVGMDAGSAYQEGTTLAPLTGTSDGSYERKLGGTSDSCIDTNDNASDFSNAGSGTLHNYASPLSLCGVARPAPSTTTTTITGDSPDPSVINGNISVSVKVSGGSSTPSGLVNITGANTNCTITLNSSGTGSCTVKFTSTGTKALIATYLGDNTHTASSDGESHLVATTSTIRTPTARPTPLPPPPLIGINEFVPRPGHDWNNDGVINVGDEYIELLNHGVIDVNLSGYSLDDEVNIGSNPYRLPAITLKPGERHVFYGSETGLLLSDGGDGVRLLKPNGQLGDAYNYFVVRFPDQSYCRLPDNGGLDDWNQNCFPTPGLQNSLSGSSVNPPTAGGAENLCPISDTLPPDFVLAECPPFGNNIWNPDYWDKFGWFDEKNLPESPGKWPVFAE